MYFLCVYYVGVCGENPEEDWTKALLAQASKLQQAFLIHIFYGVWKIDKNFNFVMLCHIHIKFMFSETSYFALSSECLICMNFSSILVVVGVMKLGLVQNIDVKNIFVIVPGKFLTLPRA